LQYQRGTFSTKEALAALKRQLQQYLHVCRRLLLLLLLLLRTNRY
jgi:hypothetical protein